MNVLHISGAKTWGGNEQQIINIIPELNNYGIKNVVLGIKNSKLQEACKVANIKFLSFDRKKLNSFSNFKQLSKFTLEYKPDLIQLHTSNSLLFFLTANLFFNLKGTLIFTKKGIGGSSSFLSKIKYNHSRIDGILCVSKSVETDFQNLLNKKQKSKTFVINDCVDTNIVHQKSSINLREKYSISTHKQIIGNIANHTQAKDLFTLIDVATLLKFKHKRDDFVIIQVGEFTKETPFLVSYASKKGVLEHLIFTNKLENACGLNNQFDIFLLSSQREGGPTSMLETMLFETPVVATNVGVVPEIISNGVSGFIAQVRDSKQLAKYTNMLLNDVDLKNDFKTASKKIILENFTEKVIAKQLIEKFHSFIA